MDSQLCGNYIFLSENADVNENSEFDCSIEATVLKNLGTLYQHKTSYVNKLAICIYGSSSDWFRTY